MKARENLRPALEKVFQSSIFDILCQSYEQIDIEQSKGRRDFLHRSRFDSTLLTNDGCLDITALLNTSTVEQLFAHVDIRPSPLTFFICAFYSLPYFPHRATLHLITRWDELVESNIDVRSFDDLPELFYCPSQTPLDCARLKFTKETQRVRVELFTLDRDFPTSELVNGLEKILPRPIDVQINPIDLFNVQDLLDKDHPQLFSFCCLLHTRHMEQTHRNRRTSTIER